MSPTRRVVIVKKHARNLLLEEASPINPILTQLVEKGFFPKILLDVVEELLLLMGRQVMRHDFRGEIVCNVSKPRGLYRGANQEVLTRKNIINGGNMALNNESGEMIGHDVLGPCLIFDF